MPCFQLLQGFYDCGSHIELIILFILAFCISDLAQQKVERGQIVVYCHIVTVTFLCVFLGSFNPITYLAEYISAAS